MFKPEFLIVPSVVIQDKSLREVDKIVFGVVYFFERLKNGKCIVSNKYIGDFAGCSERSVQDSLNRLESSGLIKRFYKDPQKRHRTHICALITHLERTFVPSIDSTNVRQKKNIQEEYNITADAVSGSTFSYKEELSKLAGSKRRQLVIIGKYFEFKRLSFDTKAKFEVALRRYLRPAKELEAFTGEEITKAFLKAEEEYPEKWTLETIIKLLTK